MLANAASPAAPPAWQQYLISYGVGRVYDAAIGPRLRAAVEHTLGRPKTRPYIPPNTPGFLARDMVYGALSYVVGQNLFRLLNRVSLNILTQPGGLAGATVRVSAAQALSGALLRMAKVSIASTIAFTLLDAVFAKWIGPPVESTVNRLTGRGAEATDTSKSGLSSAPDSTRPASSEQVARNLARNAFGSFVYTALLLIVGNPITRAVAASIPGTGGVLLGAFASSLAASVLLEAVNSTIGAKLSDAAQHAVRGVKHLLGKPVGPVERDDYVIYPGDQVSGAAKGVLVPYITGRLGPALQRH